MNDPTATTAQRAATIASPTPNGGGGDGGGGTASGAVGATHAPKPLILDLQALGVDLSARVIDRRGIEVVNPHRHEMALLDAIVWKSDDNKRGVAVWNVGDAEFWCRGHFPGKPMVPGVLQVEAGAQLSSYLYNIRFPEPRIAAFTHIADCSFRNPVTPGATFYLLCEEVKFSPRRFSSRIQGMVDGKITFDATINGMAIS